MSDFDTLGSGQIWVLKQRPTQLIPVGPTYDIVVMTLSEPMLTVHKTATVVCQCLWSTHQNFNVMYGQVGTWTIFESPLWVRLS